MIRIENHGSRNSRELLDLACRLLESLGLSV